MGRIGYYIFILPLSYLPLWVIYLKSDFFYILLITLFPYRKKVIDQNIKNSFPDMSEKDRKSIRRKFYRHFTDLLAEGIKNLSISDEELKRRMKVSNPEVMDELFVKKRSVILVSGHYNNWEWLVSGQPLLFKHKAYGIGKKMTSGFWDKKINQRRQRFGMNVIHAGNYKEALTNESSTHAILTLSDQSPLDSKKSYWMKFLNQETPVLFGAELMAHQLDYSVVYFSTKKVKRGHYTIDLELITESPRTMEWGEITEAHTGLLEKDILEHPEFWLWSHKRWKREVPTDLEELREQQRQTFNEKFPN